MLTINECLKILNQKERKYTLQETKDIIELLYQLGQIAYCQFKKQKENEKQSNIIYTGLNR